MTTPTTEALRAHYAKTALARMGIPFERGMQIEGVRIVVEGAARINGHHTRNGQYCRATMA